MRDGYKECPWCAEEIKEKAIVCRFCNRDVRTDASAGTPIPEPVLKPAAPVTEEELAEATEEKKISDLAHQPAVSGAYEKLKKVYPEKVVQGLFEGLDKIQVGERRNITVLFADICGFTSLSETLDPEQIKEIIDGCYTVMVEAVQNYEGLIDKFLGDAVMALFGAPAYSHEDDPERAIRAAIQIQEKIRQLGRRWGINLDVSIGINCGEVVVGSFGAGEQMDYTAIGDTVNLASRLQGLASRGEIFVGEKIYRLARGGLEFEFVGERDVKGKRQKVRCYKFSKFKDKVMPVGLKQRMDITPLVGRTEEKEKLMTAYQNASEGYPQAVMIVAEAGVGKSRLAYELSLSINHEFVNWYNGSFISFGQSIPYLPIKEVIKKAAEIADEDNIDTKRTKLRELIDKINLDSPKEVLDAIEFLLSVNSPDNPLLDAEVKNRKEILFASIEKVFHGLTSINPLVLVFEDLHWADPISLDFFNFFLSRLKGKRYPILIIFNFRPVFKMETPDGPGYVKILLKELDDEESKKLVYQVLGIGKLPPELEHKLLRHAEGNPFYIEEILLSLQEEGTIVLDPDTNEYMLTQPLELIRIPETIQGVILARLDQLQERLRNILQCASVIGIGFKYRILQYLIEVEKQLRDHLTKLVRQDYLLEETAIPEIFYLFKHTITREVIYGTLLKKTRRFFHGRIGVCIEDLYREHLDEHYELLAHHFYCSDETEKAVFYLEKAANKTEMLYANEAAIEFNTNLIEAIDIITRQRELKEDEKKFLCSAYANRGRVKKLIGDYAGATLDLEQAIAYTRKYKFDELEAKILKILADIFRLNGKHDKALEILRNAQVILHKYGNIFQEILTINNMGAIYRMQGNLDAAIEKYAEALKLSHDCAEIDTKATALNNLGIVFLDKGDYEKALENFNQSLEIKRNLLDKKSIMSIMNNIGIIHERKAEYDKAIESYAGALHAADEIGYHRGQLAAYLNIGQALQIIGETDKSIGNFKKVIEKSQGSEDYSVQSIAYGNLAWTLLLSGRLDSVSQIIDMAEELAEKGRNFTGKINSMLARSMHKYLKGEFADGSEIAHAALNEIEENKDADDLPLAGRMYALNLLGLKKFTDAAVYADNAANAAKSSGNIREFCWAQYTKGLILKEDGKISEADQLLTQAAEEAKKINDKSFEVFFKG